LKFSKNVNNKKCAPKLILFNEIFLTASACNAVLYISLLLLFDFQVCKKILTKQVDITFWQDKLTKHVEKTFDQTWSNLTKLDQTWPNLTKLDQTWPNLTKLDQTWPNLIKSDKNGSNYKVFVLKNHVVEKHVECIHFACK
jgi:hypothetical protein